MTFDIRALFEDLADFWWTPAPGPNYVALAPGFRVPGGPGRIAWKGPGRFNLFAALAHLKRPQDQTLNDYRRDLDLLVLSGFISQQQIDGVLVEEWATLLKPAAFYQLLAQRKGQVVAWPWKRMGCRGIQSAETLMAALGRSPLMGKAACGIGHANPNGLSRCRCGVRGQYI